MATFKVKTISTQYDSADELEITADYLDPISEGRVIALRRKADSAIIFIAPADRLVFVHRTKD